MREVRERLRALDQIQAPDLRERIRGWEPRPPRTEPSLRRVGIALLAFVVAAAGIIFAIRAFRATEPPTRPATTIENGKIAFVTDLFDDPRIWTMNPDGSDSVELARGRDPAWSPDGTRIAFTTDRNGLGIDVMNADGMGVEDLTRDPAFAQEPAWSPDGTQIAFMASDGIYVMNADGSDVHRVTGYSGPRACGDFDPSWSPNGATIAFAVRCDGGGLGIWTVGIDGSDRTLLVGPEDDMATYAHPAWSPDGATIAYEVDNFGPFVQPTSAIYLVDADGSDATKLADGQQPTWSPDGTKIVFVSGQDIYVMYADGTDVTRLTSDRAPYSEPAWQPLPVLGETPRPTETPTPAERPVGELIPRVSATIRVGSFPTGVAVGEGFVWAATQDPVGLESVSGVVKIDPETNEVIDAIPVQDAVDVAVGAGAVWVTSGEGNEGVIRRIDPVSDEVVATIPVGLSPSNVGFGEDAVWVTLNLQSKEPTGEVVRINPATNEVVARIRVDGGWPRDIVIGEGAVWVYGHSKHSGDVWEASSLWQIDPASNRLMSTVLEQRGFLGDGSFLPDNMAIGQGSVWVADDSGSAVRIDPTTGGASTFHVKGGLAWPFLIYEGKVLFGISPMRILDTETLEVEGALELQSQIADAALDPATGVLWVANYEDAITRIALR